MRHTEGIIAELIEHRAGRSRDSLGNDSLRERGRRGEIEHKQRLLGHVVVEFAIDVKTFSLLKGVVHHSDRGSQYLSIRYSERLAEAGAEPSVGSVGDSYDNALAETIIGLYKTEVIHRRGPWRHLEAVEYATLEWVDWFNHRRLLEPIGNVPPAELEAKYYHSTSQLPLAA